MEPAAQTTPVVGVSKDPWGLVGGGQDPDTYRGADGDAAATPERKDGAEVDDAPAHPRREIMEQKTRLREIVEYLFLCNILDAKSMAAVCNKEREHVGVLGRIPAEDMERRIAVVLEAIT